MDKWEYIKVSANEDLNKYGRQGWEMAGINPGMSGQIIFKRKIPDSPRQEIQKPMQGKSVDDDFEMGF